MTPRQRTEKLALITRANAVKHHAWLRWCFEQELADRLSDARCEHFENIYHCALLLHIIADLADLPLMFRAKLSGDMDLAIGFDWQFLFMREPAEIVQYAISIQRPDIARWIDEHTTDYLEEDMDQWLSESLIYHDVPRGNVA